jgi:hydrogenase maturation protein HypF
VLFRTARGYAPITAKLPISGPSVLAAGGDLKNAFCITAGDEAIVSPYVGDLENPDVQDHFLKLLEHFKAQYRIKPELCVCDRHPDYVSTRMAESMGFRGNPFAVQHHHAHALSCLADNGTLDPAIAVVMDGTGYGDDGTIWGGEILMVDGLAYKRLGHLKTMSLLGGDKAARATWRMAAGLLHDLFGDEATSIASEIPGPCFSDMNRLKAILSVAGQGANTFLTSSAGRLFDGVSALLNICPVSTYEGQAAIELEACASLVEDDGAFAYTIKSHGEGQPFQIDFSNCIREILEEIRKRVPSPLIARRFHNTVIHAMAQGVQKAARHTGLSKVVLSGGTMQNKIIVTGLIEKLIRQGFEVLTHRTVPPNDGGICLGQAVAGLLHTAKLSSES